MYLCVVFIKQWKHKYNKLHLRLEYSQIYMKNIGRLDHITAYSNKKENTRYFIAFFYCNVRIWHWFKFNYNLPVLQARSVQKLPTYHGSYDGGHHSCYRVRASVSAENDAPVLRLLQQSTPEQHSRTRRLRPTQRRTDRAQAGVLSVAAVFNKAIFMSL